MDTSIHKKGSDYYDMTKWLLDHYLEFSTLNSTFQYYSNELGGEVSLPIISNRRSFIDIICDLMFKSLNYLDQSGHKYARILFVHFFSERYADISVGERVSHIGYTTGGYYHLMYRGIEKYSSILWEAIENNRNLPFFMYDTEGKKALIGRMKEALNLHNVGYSCYIDTERILKNYSRIKYCEVNGPTAALGEEALNYGDDVYMPEGRHETSYMELIADSMKKMQNMGPYGRDCVRFLNTVFFDPGIRDKPWKTKMRVLGMSPRTYYKERNRSIRMISQVIWGSMGERHYRSPFFEKKLP